MRIYPWAWLSAAALTSLVALGCGGNDDGTADSGTADGARSDSARGDSVADQWGPDALGQSNIGEACQGVTGCEPASPVCLVFDSVEARGICTRPCTPDDPGTPGFNEDDCPIGSACAVLDQGVSFCLKTCTPKLAENTCPANTGQACRPESTVLLPTSRRAVCWLQACTADRDCPVVLETECTSDSPCKQAHGDEAFCFNSQQRCALPGSCTASGICGPHGKGNAGARVGDPCNSDTQCTDNGFCFFQQQAGATGRIVWRNGYCSIANCVFARDLPEFDCASSTSGEGSTCHFGYPTGLCHRVCELGDADGCRGGSEAGDQGGDYECYNYAEVVTQEGLPLTDLPVCEVARGCAGLGIGLACEDLGNQGNGTQMECRSRLTGASVDVGDENGFCLDLTASGNFEASPLD